MGNKIEIGTQIGLSKKDMIEEITHNGQIISHMMTKTSLSKKPVSVIENLLIMFRMENKEWEVFNEKIGGFVRQNSPRYENGYDYFFDLVHDFGQKEGINIAREYLDLQKNNKDKEEISFCDELRSAIHRSLITA